MKVVMVLVIILTMWHLTSFGREQRSRRDLESFDKKENYGDRHRRGGKGKEPNKGEGGDFDVIERTIDQEKDGMPPQIDVEKGDTAPQILKEKGDMPHQIDVEKGDNTPLILLWNNYQGDKSALYNKIFHR